MKKQSILYIAYHYPPILGSSGVHRTLAFTRHLHEQGWDVRVLTTSVKAYSNWANDQYSFIPKGINVIRAFARDVTRHFSWRKKYLFVMSLPDNWQSWILGGLLSGLLSIVKNKPGVIVSTYPIASAHIIGYLLHRFSGVPWVADLRDPMAQADYPSEPKKKRIFEWIERKIVKHCQYAIITAPGAKAFYQQKFPDTDESFWQVIPNGYDETIFDDINPSPKTNDAKNNLPVVLLHSGVIYPSERDPNPFFQALSELKQEKTLSASDLTVRLRASGHDELFQTKIDELDIADIVKLEPTIAYRQALQEMLDVDALLLLQAANCNYQIPAKAYEYIKVQKPILALTPIEGDTGQLLVNAGNTAIAPLDDKVKIKNVLVEFLDNLRQSSFRCLSEDEVRRYSRKSQAEKLRNLLISIITRNVS